MVYVCRRNGLTICILRKILRLKPSSRLLKLKACVSCLSKSQERCAGRYLRWWTVVQPDGSLVCLNCRMVRR
ncbi:Uncharacterised protein [Vibrio cholerae]|nr:Uncharacterised protein [Vibrio cholerae]